MANLKGFRANALFKHAPTWGTAVAGVALDGLEILNEAGDADTEEIEDEGIQGSDFQRESDAGSRSANGALTVPARYEGLEPLIAHVFGTAGVPATIEITARQHDLKLNPDMEGIFGTIAFDKKVKIHEFNTAKLTGMSLKCASGKRGRAEITFRYAANDFSDASAINTAGTFASVTLPANREFLQFSQLIVRLNAQGGAGLASPTDDLYVTEVNLDIDRAYRIDEYSTQFGNRISEPLQNGWGKVTGSLTYARYTDASPGGNSALFTGALAKTRYKMDWVWTAAALAGSAQKFQHKLLFPNIQLGKATPQIIGPGVSGWTQPFMGKRVLAAPTGMTGVLAPVQYTIISQRAGDPLV